MHFYQESRQIETITCEYCNQVHSVKDNFKTLYRYQKSMNSVRRIPLGTVGKIKDIEFTVIGYVVYTEEKVESLEELDSNEWWIEYQLYSKTHGYAYLTYEDESYYFYHRVYDLPQPLMNHAKEFNTVHFRDKSFKVAEPYSAYAYFIAGTLTWKAKVGDSSYCVDAKSSSGWFSKSSQTLSYERSKIEEEYFLGEPIEYLDKVFRDGVTIVKKQYGLFLFSFIAFLVAFIALIVLSQMKEYKIFHKDFKTTSIESSERFHLNNPNVKHKVKLKAEVPFGEKVHESLTIKEAHSSSNTLKKDINMSYRLSTVTIPFEPSVRGVTKYQLTLKDQNSTADTTLKLTITQPLLQRYFVVLLIVSMIGMFLSYILKDEKEAWLTLWVTTIFVYIVAIFPISFIFLGLLMIVYFAYRLGVVGFVSSLLFYIIMLNIL